MTKLHGFGAPSSLANVKSQQSASSRSLLDSCRTRSRSRSTSRSRRRSSSSSRSRSVSRRRQHPSYLEEGRMMGEDDDDADDDDDDGRNRRARHGHGPVESVASLPTTEALRSTNKVSHHHPTTKRPSSRSFHESSSRSSANLKGTPTTSRTKSRSFNEHYNNASYSNSVGISIKLRRSIDPDGGHRKEGGLDDDDDDFAYSSRAQRLAETKNRISRENIYAHRGRKKDGLMRGDYERVDDDDDDDDDDSGSDDDDEEIGMMEESDNFNDAESKRSRHSSGNRRQGKPSSSSSSRGGAKNKHNDSLSLARERIRRRSRSSSRSRISSSRSRKSSTSRSRKSTTASGRSSSRRSSSRSRKSTSSRSSRTRSHHSSSRSQQAKSRSHAVKSSSSRKSGREADEEEEYTGPRTIPADKSALRPPPNSPRFHRDDGAIPDMTDKTIGGETAHYTTVSSMTSTDSYVKYQQHLRGRKVHDRKMAELEALRERREARKQKAEEEGYFYEGEDATVVVEEGDHDSFYSEEGDHTRSHSDVKSHEGSRYSRSRRSRNSRRSKDNETEARKSHNSNKEGSSNQTPASHDYSTPVYQREETCIKHPHVLLTDQTDVKIWTCMKYCKDPDSGRWNTVKMICTECLAEDEEDHRYDTPYHRKFRRDLRGFRPLGYGHTKPRNVDDPRDLDPTRESGLGDDLSACSSGEDMCYMDNHDGETCSTSSQSYRPNGNNHNSSHRDTINVHPMADQTPLEREAEAQRRRFVRRLAARAYHFPGNTWCEDWIQYTSNTHLVLGIFFHHSLHPVRSTERFVILLGSVAVGLLMSNLIYLWFVHAGFGMQDTVLSLGPNGDLDVTKLMITLWTLGSFAHTLFDLSIWHIKACTLCRYGREDYVSDSAVKCGRTAGVTIVLMTFSFAAYLVLLRASRDYKDGLLQVGIDNDAGGESDLTDDIMDDDIVDRFIQPISLGGGAKYFDFLLGYIIEFVLAVFVYNPLILTVVFTGILGCDGRIPILGGRPREVMSQQRYAMKRQRYTMPQTLKLGDQEYEADGMYRGRNQKPVTNF